MAEPTGSTTVTPSRPLTVDEFEAEAEALELGAQAARASALDEWVQATIAGRGGRDEAWRKHFAADAAADRAAKQVADERSELTAYTKSRDMARDRAAAARSKGDDAGAREHDEEAEWAASRMRVAEHLVQEAEHARQVHRAEADRALDGSADETLDYGKRWRRREELEDVFDAQEEQAMHYRTAAAQLREAERLEAALPDLEARQVPGFERVRAAAAERRNKAADAMEEAWAVEDAMAARMASPPSAAATPAPTAPPATPEPDEIEMPPMDMRQPEPADEIEVPPVDTSEDGEIEMPPMDMTGADDQLIEMEG